MVFQAKIKMNAIILCGGKSSRFGSDKAFIEIEGTPLIERQIQALKGSFKNFILVANQPEKYNFKNVKVVEDIIKGQGPLAGIHSGLTHSDSFYNFFLPCDMPNLNLELINYVLSLKDGFDAVVPKLKKGYETLFAVYSKNCLPSIEEALRARKLKVMSFFEKVKLRQVKEEEILRFGTPEILFTNINTKDDLCRISTSLKK